MSLRRFTGWEPARTTTYEYDDAGRLVSSTTVSEPEWDADQQAWVLALAAYERDLCPGCGLPLSDTTHEIHRPDGKLDIASYEQYEVTASGRCFACAAVDDARGQFESWKSPESLRLQIRRR